MPDKTRSEELESPPFPKGYRLATAKADCFLTLSKAMGLVKSGNKFGNRYGLKLKLCAARRCKLRKPPSRQQRKPLPLTRLDLKRHLPIPSQLPQNLICKRLNGLLPHLVIQLLAIHGRDQLLDGDAPLGKGGSTPLLLLDTSKRLQHFLLPPFLYLKLQSNFCRQVPDHLSMCRIAEAAVMRLHDPQRLHPRRQELDGGRAVAEHVVPREHGVFLLEDEAHVVVGVAGSVHGPDCGAPDAEHLAVCDRLLVLCWGVFVDGVKEVGVESDEVRDTSGVVSVPMGQEDVGQGDGGVGESGPDQVRPFWDPLAGVDDESLTTRSDDVRVCALERELEDERPVS